MDIQWTNSPGEEECLARSNEENAGMTLLHNELCSLQLRHRRDP